MASLAVAVLSTLVITGEYSAGMVCSTLAAVPGRLQALWAKGPDGLDLLVSIVGWHFDLPSCSCSSGRRGLHQALATERRYASCWVPRCTPRSLPRWPSPSKHSCGIRPARWLLCWACSGDREPRPDPVEAAATRQPVPARRRRFRR